MNHDSTFLSNATEATIRIGILALLIAHRSSAYPA